MGRQGHPVNRHETSAGSTLCARYSGAAPRACNAPLRDRKSTRLNSSHQIISYAVFCLKKKTQETANLGKLMVSSILLMMAINLGHTLEGSYADVIATKATNSPFFFNDAATTEIYTLSLHDALPI